MSEVWHQMQNNPNIVSCCNHPVERWVAYLEVVRPHEHVSNAIAHDTLNPLVKVLGLCLGDSICHLGICQTSQALDLQGSRKAQQACATSTC